MVQKIILRFYVTNFKSVKKVITMLELFTFFTNSKLSNKNITTKHVYETTKTIYQIQIKTM